MYDELGHDNSKPKDFYAMHQSENGLTNHAIIYNHISKNFIVTFRGTSPTFQVERHHMLQSS
jgi:hypothetical protein